MQLEVGQQIAFQGRTWLVFEIERSDTTFIADKTSDELRGIHGTATNVKILDQHLDDFGPGDIVEQHLEVVQLIIPGEHIFFIYNKRHYRRIKSATQSVDQASDREAQGAEQRAPGGVRNGREGVSETSGAQDRDGSTGARGNTGDARGSEGGQYAAAERGGGDAEGDQGQSRPSTVEARKSVAELLQAIRSRGGRAG